MPNIKLEKLHRGYRLTDWTHRSFVLSAQDLRDIYNWYLLHKAEIEAEAKRDEGKPEAISARSEGARIGWQIRRAKENNKS